VKDKAERKRRYVMKRLLTLAWLPVVLIACAPSEEGGQDQAAEAAGPGIQLDVTPPEPLEVPEPKPVSSDTDWEAKAHNKNIEVIEVMNVINPVAAYITKGFDEYGDRFSPVLQEEWSDTQAQLTKATTLYEASQERMAAGEYDRELFLDLEEVWQLLVKTGVAGVRTKSMVDQELAGFAR
jgi:hypothetical protein